MKYATSLLVTMLLALAPGAASADEEAPGFDSRDYITPSVMLTRPVSDDDLYEGLGVHLGITRPLSERYHIEGSWFGYNTSVRGTDDDQRRRGVGVTGLRMFGSSSSLQPYFSFGAGMLETRFRAEEDTSLFSSVGLGMMYHSSEDISLRLDARYMYDLGRAIQPDWQLMLGASFRFGERPRHSSPYSMTPDPAPEEPPPPAAPARETQPQPEPDPMPPPEQPAADVILQFDPILFEFDSSRLTSSARDRLDRAAMTLDEHSNIRVEVIGYTCNIGPSSYNQRLAEQRARAVADYLEAQGVDRSRMDVNGFGEAQPPADGESGRRENRRVDIKPRN